MGRSVIITTPIPTVEELAKRLRIGKKRLAMIREIVRQVRESSNNGTATAGSADGAAQIEKADS